MKNTILTVMMVVLFVGTVNAEFVWVGDFESYNEGDSVITNATGDNDTFTSWLQSSGTLSPQLTAVDASAVGLVDGLSGKLTSGNSYTSDKTVRLHQDALGSYGAGLLVLSFDRVRPSDTHWSNLTMWFDDSEGARIGASGLSFSDAAFFGATKVGRVTMVLNRTGVSVTLPGSLGALATGYYAIYGKDQHDGTYVGFLTKAIDATLVAGFTLEHMISANEVVPNYQLLDNMVVSDSLSDSVGGVNILELDFGTQPLVHPKLSMVVISTQ